MRRLRLRRGWGLLSALMCVVLLGACGGEAAAPPIVEEEQPQEQPEQEVRVLNLTSAEVGAHLEREPYEFTLPSSLAASGDPVLAALPARAVLSSGNVYSPAEGSPTGETMWLHVFTDESAEAALGFVEYAAAQPPTVFNVLARHHDFVDAAFLPPPAAGDAAVSIELIHGHAYSCFRSNLLIFAQGRVLIFLSTTIEITGEQEAGPSGRGHCDLARIEAALTDLEAVAGVISDWLAGS